MHKNKKIKKILAYLRKWMYNYAIIMMGHEEGCPVQMERAKEAVGHPAGNPEDKCIG